MAVLPGSLDYLYYNGILDHIPYEAYQMGPITPSGMMQMSGMGTGYGVNPMMMGSGSMPPMNATNYLRQAQQGMLYDTYTCPDTFVKRNNHYKTGENYSIAQKAFQDGDGYSRDVDYDLMANGNEGKSFWKKLAETGSKVKDVVIESPTWAKGLLAGGIMITTLACLFKRGRVPKVK